MDRVVLVGAGVLVAFVVALHCAVYYNAFTLAFWTPKPVLGGVP